MGGVPLCLGMSFIKYKQTNSIIAAVISGVVFFCTIVAIQVRYLYTNVVIVLYFVNVGMVACVRDVNDFRKIAIN